MSKWRLVDGREPADGPDEFRSVAITSEAQLRKVLNRLQKLEPAMVALISPAEQSLQIGIGGPVAGIRYFAAAQQSPRHRTVLADCDGGTERVDFIAEGDSVAFFRECLIPVDEVVEIAVHFFKHQQLPDSVSWREWDPATMQWQTNRGAAVST